MEISLPYGKSHINAVLPDEFTVEYIAPRSQAAAQDPAATVMQAVYNPLGDVSPPRAGMRVAIAINDKTRPVPHESLLPPVLAGLRRAGIRDLDVHVIIATGTHPVITPDEYGTILPRPILDTYRVSCHDAYNEHNLTALGETSRGTPIAINSDYMKADYRIVIGNIEPHQFQGFSGGVKSAAIGLAGVETINRNHAMMRQPQAIWGSYADNPARQDVEEIGARIGIDFCVNAILNAEKGLARALAGEPVAVMRAGIPSVRELYAVPVSAPVALMIASPGGHPKDINLYQAQKGMAHASVATRSGGRMILCAACPEGAGNADYERWMRQPQIDSHAAVLAEFAREGFRVGRHKAFQVSRDASRVQTALVTDMADELARALLLAKAASLQAAVDEALATLALGARIGVMPAANATMPVVL
ncbi:MAG: nickel-dependent lactate racemase [Chloroflexi bacterium]|nr:nickel-dependent lactate racemase [Chloroflexota bacterium]MCY4247363.1 nickel-dependent lactate racemase [Chloroflexota bacterium]